MTQAEERDTTHVVYRVRSEIFNLVELESLAGLKVGENSLAADSVDVLELPLGRRAFHQLCTEMVNTGVGGEDRRDGARKRLRLLARVNSTYLRARPGKSRCPSARSGRFVTDVSASSQCDRGHEDIPLNPRPPRAVP